MKIYPSLINADLLNLERVIKELEGHCDGFHLDVMDNHFVPNLTWGPAFINAIARLTTKPCRVHLMVTEPQALLDRFILPKSSVIIFHKEAAQNPLQTIKKIIQKGWIAGIAINPKIGVESIKELLQGSEEFRVHELLVLSVEPGFSGQAFMPEVLPKAQWLATYRKAHSLSYAITMDGGINKENIGHLKNTGVDGVAVAQGIFGEQEPVRAVEELKMQSR